MSAEFSEQSRGESRRVLGNPLIRRIQAELGAAVVIEHDMPLVMSISDRVYCLEAGRVISEGSPEEVRNDPLVIASYLGTDVRAIERSGERTT